MLIVAAAAATIAENERVCIYVEEYDRLRPV
jgi:hypothetical protein